MKPISSRFTWVLLPLLLLTFVSAGQPEPIPPLAVTAGELLDKIKAQLTCDWATETVDTYKGGGPDVEVTGIATTFLATLDVLKRAKARGLNFVITHEPTFYNHFDRTEQYGDDEVLAAKQKFIADNDMIVFRFHDHWHRTAPDGIYKGMTAKLGWEAYSRDGSQYYYDLPPMSLKKLAKQLKKKFARSTIRVVGDIDTEVSRIGLVLGAAGSMRQIESLQRDDVEVVIAGEVPEWETVEYIRDAVSMGKKKALILLGHANSEEAGMAYCADWLKTFISEVPVEFIPAGDPFWSPGTRQ
ncbi:Nif3-like dinuclear metal center hexameric protein [Flavilitoribacter nigricans]|nr:Nif3-like dinuclear metal center hexameric protein [Flavilitoribacter nigricans]